MYLFWGSRLTEAGDLKDFLKKPKEGSYYVDNVKYPVCVAYEDGENMEVKYPFCASSVSK